MGWLFWAVSLMLVLFLISFNGALHGAWKEMIANIISWLLFGLIAVAFFVSGWKFGLATLVGSFIVGSLFQPLASGLARRVYTRRFGGGP